MTKIVYNNTFGGFGLSDKGIKRYAAIKGMTLWPEKNAESGFMVIYWLVPPNKREGILHHIEWYKASLEDREKSNQRHKELVLYDRDIKRDDPVLVRVVEELSDEANGMYAKLVVVELTAGTHYRITEYDGNETVELRDEIEWNIA